MGGTKSGVATQLNLLNGKCLFTHCYGHVLNIAVGDVIRNFKDLKEMFSTAYEICKLVKKSPKRNARPDQIRNSTKHESKGIQTLCPTRSTVRGDGLTEFIDNNTKLMDLWDWSLQATSDTEMKARLQGVKAFVSTFHFCSAAPLVK